MLKHDLGMLSLTITCSYVLCRPPTKGPPPPGRTTPISSRPLPPAPGGGGGNGRSGPPPPPPVRNDPPPPPSRSNPPPPPSRNDPPPPSRNDPPPPPSRSNPPPAPPSRGTEHNDVGVRGRPLPSQPGGGNRSSMADDPRESLTASITSRTRGKYIQLQQQQQ